VNSPGLERLTMRIERRKKPSAARMAKLGFLRVSVRRDGTGMPGPR
jgi:hypothetical protein